MTSPTPLLITILLSAAAPQAVCVAADARPSDICPEGGLPRAQPEVLDPFWVPLRLRAQQLVADQYQVFHEFRFVDRIEESGITFQHHIVDDAAKDYKPVHYDHGNGVAVADVDGDERLDIYFTTQLGANGLWRNLGNGRFEDITRPAGVAVESRISVTASFADIDNDGDPDLYVTTVRGGNLMFENDGTGRFLDITSQAGLEHVGHSSAAVFFDFDNDGLLDLFLTNVGKYTREETGRGGYYIGYRNAFSGHLFAERTEYHILYRNLGHRRFVDVSRDTGLLEGGWGGDASFLDLNEDGWLDLYVLSMQGHDEYWENQGGERFVKRSREIFPVTPWGSMGIRVFDYNNDGRMDIFLTDMHTDMIMPLQPNQEKKKIPRNRPLEALGTDGNHVLGNALFRNDGNGRFTEVSDQTGAENYWPWGLSTGDLNADGWEDVFITASMNYPFRYGINSVLLNENGQRFVDSEYLVGVEPRKDGRTAKPWFDLDCSGLDATHRDCTGMSGCITVMGAVGSRASVIFDLDEDGDLDIVTNEFNDRPMVLVSNLTDVKAVSSLEVELKGRRSNRSGIGARISLAADTKRQVKINDGKSGYLSQSDQPVYFGLGTINQVDRIEVDWPSGIKQTLDVDGHERRLVIEEPEATENR